MSMARDKTISHFHTDPIFIEQIGAGSSLIAGQFVYLDTDNFYKPAIALTEKESNVQGYVWSFVGSDAFYLKTDNGPMRYRFPFTRDFFNNDINGRIDEYSPNILKIPGSLGEKLYLSETEAGSVQTTQTSLYKVIIGYKTDYGIMYNLKHKEPCCDN